MPTILFAGLPSNDIHLMELLTEKGYQVTSARTLYTSIETLNRDDVDVVVTGASLSRNERDEIVTYLSGNAPKIRCIVLADDASVDDSVSSFKKGVYDYIALPVENETFVASVRSALDGGNTDNTISESEDRRGDYNGNDFIFYDFIGESDEIKRISSVIRRVSVTDSTVLITGESGTGKELIARAIHKNSPRRNAPMVIINCGSIPSELLESELFGHEKGAFTGAHRTRMGRFELADGGTIFLDEIGDMSPDLQVKLLRVIQEQCFERVGGIKSIHVNVRIISATNKELKKAINDNLFREDLYYRLNVIPIHVPPLRDRKSDIPLLVNHFIQKLHDKNSWGIKSFSPEAMDALYLYDWTGNVRELENLMERLSVLVETDIVSIDDLPENISGKEHGEKPVFHTTVNDVFRNGRGFNEAVEEHQKQLILHALNKTNWVKAKAAELLKMKRTTLVEKIKKMNLEPETDG